MLLAIVAVLAASYLFFLLFAWQCADRIIFASPRSSYDAGADFSSIRGDDGTPLTCAHLVAQDATATLLYLHGNGEDLGDILPFLQEVRRRGLSVFAIDYRGYGTSPGTPTEANLCADVLAVFRHLTAEAGIPANRIVAYGRSLGSGPAVYLAASEPIGGLVLEGAFTSAFRVVTQIPILPMDRFANLRRLSTVRCPVLVMHAVHDQTVPFAHGRRLFAAAPEPKRHLWIRDMHHNDFTHEPTAEYWEALLAFVRSLPAS